MKSEYFRDNDLTWLFSGEVAEGQHDEEEEDHTQEMLPDLCIQDLIESGFTSEAPIQD